MPLYEYECETCGHRLEVIQKFSDDPLVECPKCKGKLAKLLSAPAIQFKGSGWYVTDYSRKQSGGSSSESKSESKQDTAQKAEPAKSKSEDSSKKTETKKSTD